MVAFFATAASAVITRSPCILYSVTLTPGAATSGDVTLYAGRSAVSGDEIVTVRTANSQTTQVAWKGLECPDGLYLSVGSNVTLVTVEWEPAGYPGKGESGVEYMVKPAASSW